MIWESWPWKRELSRRAKAIERRAAQTQWSEASLAKVEQDLLLAAYSIRKLVESNKISDAVGSVALGVREYPRRERSVDAVNWHKIAELYALDAAAKRTLGIRALCNQVIHSFVLVFEFAKDGGLNGFFVSSDKTKDDFLYFVPLNGFVILCRKVADDDVVDVVDVEWTRANDGEGIKVQRKSKRSIARNQRAPSSRAGGRSKEVVR